MKNITDIKTVFSVPNNSNSNMNDHTVLQSTLVIEDGIISTEIIPVADNFLTFDNFRCVMQNIVNNSLYVDHAGKIFKVPVKQDIYYVFDPLSSIVRQYSLYQQFYFDLIENSNTFGFYHCNTINQYSVSKEDIDIDYQRKETNFAIKIIDPLSLMICTIVHDSHNNTIHAKILLKGKV